MLRRFWRWLLGEPTHSGCATCAAKEQTITLLADVVDWHRSTGTAAPTAQEQHYPALSVVDGAERMWVTDEEEDIEAALASGAIDNTAAERALAQIQAQNTSIEIVS